MWRVAPIAMWGLPVTVAALVICWNVVPGGRAWMQERASRIAYHSANRQAFTSVVRPAVDWVRGFHREHGRFPTQAEVTAHASAAWPEYGLCVWESPLSWQRTRGKAGVDFTVCVRAEEWNLYMQSWDRQTFMEWTE